VLSLKLLLIRLAGMHNGARHEGGLVPYGEDPTVLRIDSRGKVDLEKLATDWCDRRYSIALGLRQSEIELQIAEADWAKAQSVYEAYANEHRRGHRGLDPLGGRGWTGTIGSATVATVCFVAELPLTGLAFEKMAFNDFEKVVATAGVAALTVVLGHLAGNWFARPAKTLTVRIVGWLIVLAQFAILTTLALVRSQAIHQHPHESTPAVQLQIQERDGQCNV
jgi:hypothetical protein